MRYIFLIVFLFLFIPLLAQEPFKRSDNFSGIDMEGAKVEWGHLTVPENWQHDNGNKVILAVSILRSAVGQAKDAIVFIAGGPGGNSLKTVKKWLNNPVHQSHDIIFVDMRGSGFSSPQLCPDLGRSFMEIIADDNTAENDIQARVIAAEACKNELLKRHIDISAYNSSSMAEDLHALKAALGYDKWSVYGVSYGTRIAFEYVKRFPGDVNKLVMDSPVTPYAGLYDHNTRNFMRAMQVLFEKYRQATNIDLEKIFYNTLEELNQHPWTVHVSKDITPSGKFTLNAQDFLVTVQQGLYERKFFEILPAVIGQFHDRNEAMVIQLINSMKNHLNLDYGAYYCVLCNETLPVNSLEAFMKDASAFKGSLAAGVAFYKGDYAVCAAWGHDTSTRADTPGLIGNFPALILSGEFDPIIPPENAQALKPHFQDPTIVLCANQGHVPGFTKCGTALINAFLDGQRVDGSCYEKDPVRLSAGIRISSGIPRLAAAIKHPGLPLAPLAISLLLLLYAFVRILITRQKTLLTWIVLITILLVFITWSALIWAINTTASANFYILALGLPAQYTLLFVLPYAIAILSLLIILLSYRRAKWNYWYVLAGLLIVIIYFFYWHLFY
jgi:pimeloyl-ACP methyl ester carboxylesterase